MARQREELGSDGRAEAASPAPPARNGKLALRLTAVGAALVVAVLAVQQLRTRGTDVAGPLSIADHRATGTAEDGPAPAFELPALEGGGTIGLHDFPGKVVVLNFWASWCAPCRAEAPELQATWEAYRGRGVQFLGVDHQDARAAARAFVAEFGLTYPSVFDPAGELAFDYGLVGLPTTIIITPERRIAYRFTGKVDDATLREALDGVVRSSGGA